MASKQLPRMSMINHAAGIFADMSVDGPSIGTLVAIIDRAKNLPNRKTMGKQNPYCAARLGKEAKKTETDLRGGQTPRWDHELRFTVHESPDYFRLKVSVFNDDKKTDMIGETWVDLKDLIIPGGGQSDNWHPLQCRGRYAGEVRIEMTFYDTRVQDEAVIERRSNAAGRIQARTSGSTSSSSTMSGPRQPKDIKRRPLPTDPNNPTHVRPPPPEKLHTAPAPSQLPSVRAPYPEQQQQQYGHHHTYSMPAPNVSSEHLRQPSRHSMVMQSEFDVPTHAPTGPRPARGHESPDDFQRELNQPGLPVKFPPAIHQQTPVHSPVTYPQPTPSTRNYAVEQQHSYREPPSESYSLQARSNHGRPHSSYDGVPPPMDYRVSRQDLYQNSQEQLPPAEPVEPRRNSHVYETRPRQPSTQDYPFSSSERFLRSDEPSTYETAGNYALRHSRSVPDEPLHEYVPAPLPEPEPEQDRFHYRQHSNLVASTRSSLRNSMSRSEPQIQYARMQPKVEDEEDEGPPPPPPVHRSGLGQSSQQLVPSPRSSYRAYSPEYAPSPSVSDDVNLPSQPSHYIPGNVRLQDLPPHTNASSMPPSLVAGFDPGIADAETDRMFNEKRESKRRSVLFEEDGMVTQPPASQPAVSQPPVSMPPEPTPVVPPYPVDPPAKPVSQPAPQPAEDRGSMSGALVRSRGSSAASDSRIVPRRKSVSPQPPPVEARSSGTIPFSPDSYDALNPNASRSALTADPAREYDSPAQAMEAARRSETEAKRDPGPIIDDNGREIDPSDHLPTDTWAPEPEKKNRKPELVVRFKNPPTQTSPPPAARESRPLRVTFKPSADRVRTYSPDKSLARPNSSHQRGSVAVDRTSPRMDLVRGRDAYTEYNRGRDYSRSPNMDSSSYTSSRTSVSPSPGSHTSSLYAPVSTGPPIPAKVPIAQPMNQSYPIIPVGTNYTHPSGNESGGLDALSRELNTIDIGSVGCNTNRAIRKYVPRVTTGYAA